MGKPRYRDLYEKYQGSVAYVVIEISGKESMGSAFHIGEGVFVTAGHVAKMPITKIGAYDGPGIYKEVQLSAGPFFHPDEKIDIAAFVVSDAEDIPVAPLGGHLDDWISDEDFVLRSVLIMGFPPIPFSDSPVLVAARAEVNALIDKYTGGHPHFVISAMACGGFSGGPCLIEWGFVLGVVTESLLDCDRDAELGYMAVLTVEPIFVCLGYHGILPRELTGC